MKNLIYRLCLDLMRMMSLIVSYQTERYSYRVESELIPFNAGDLGLFLGVILGILIYLSTTHVIHVPLLLKKRFWLLIPILSYIFHHFIIVGTWKWDVFPGYILLTKDLDFILGIIAGSSLMFLALASLNNRYGDNIVRKRHLLPLVALVLNSILSIYLAITEGVAAGMVVLVGLTVVIGILTLLFDATLLTLAVVLELLKIPEAQKDTARAFTGLVLLTGGSLLFVLRKFMDQFPIEIILPWQEPLRFAFFQWGTLLILSAFIILTITKIKSKAYIEIGRPYMALLGIFPILLGMTIIAGGLSNLIREISTTFTSFLALMIGAFTSVMFTNTYNAVHDHQEDAISKPHRPIPSGLMSAREGLYLSLVPAIITLTLSFLFMDPIFYLLAPAFLFIGWLYSKTRIKGRYLVPYLWMGSGYVMGGMVVGWLYLFSIRSTWPPLKFWVLTAMLGVFTFFGTVMKDLGDMTGDAKIGYKTVPLLHGENTSVKMVTLSFFLPLVFGPLYMIAFETFQKTLAWLLISAVILLPFSVFLARRLHLILNSDTSTEEKTKRYQSLFIPTLAYHLFIHVAFTFVLGIL